MGESSQQTLNKGTPVQEYIIIVTISTMKEIKTVIESLNYSYNPEIKLYEICLEKCDFKMSKNFLSEERERNFPGNYKPLVEILKQKEIFKEKEVGVLRESMGPMPIG